MAFNFKLSVHKIIALLVIWQFLSVGLMAVGTWPASMAVVSTVLLAVFILLSKPYYSVLLLTLSIPFYVVVPNAAVDNLPMWRPLFAWLFLIWLIHLLINQRQWLMRVFQIQRWQSDKPLTGARLREIIKHALQRIDSRFMPWDKVAVLFLVLALCSLLIARFPIHGLKQILFLLNVYIFYVVVINAVTDREKVQELIRYVKYSLLIMVGLGFVQYVSTMFAEPYYFWQYWALTVSNLYYGSALSDVLAYSNSWFSFSGGARSLRMFGILPDTHAFGVICIFLLAYLVPHINWQEKAAAETAQSPFGKEAVPKGIQTRIKNYWRALLANKWYILLAIFLTAFGVMANGTRGVWLTMLAPLLIVIVAAVRRFLPELMKTLLAVYALIVLLFVASPFISQGLNFIRTYDANDNFLDRAGSIYDLNESSNAGRLEVWKNSAQFAAVHPFGVGYGNFIVSLVNRIPERADYEDVAEMRNFRYNLPQEFVTAHSLYLQLLVELGFAGLLAFLLFWWEYFERLWRFVKKHATSRSPFVYLTASLALSFIWILAYGVFDLTILNDRVLQYLFLSLAISGLIFAKYDSIEPE